MGTLEARHPIHALLVSDPTVPRKYLGRPIAQRVGEERRELLDAIFTACATTSAPMPDMVPVTDVAVGQDLEHMDSHRRDRAQLCGAVFIESMKNN